MKTKTYARSLVATAALACILVPAGVTLAQNRPATPGTIVLPPGSFNPSTARRNVSLAPGLTMCGSGAGGAVLMGPCAGPIGTRIAVQLNQSLSAAPAILSFKAVVSRGIPARVHVRLQGGGFAYATQAPQQLCIQGGGTWVAELVLANGQNVGEVGGFTPTDCTR